MHINRIIGAGTDDERKGVEDTWAIWLRGGAWSPQLLKRMPRGRVEIHLARGGEDSPRAIMVIENGVVTLHRVDAPKPDKTD